MSNQPSFEATGLALWSVTEAPIGAVSAAPSREHLSYDLKTVGFLNSLMGKFLAKFLEDHLTPFAEIKGLRSRSIAMYLAGSIALARTAANLFPAKKAATPTTCPKIKTATCSVGKVNLTFIAPTLELSAKLSQKLSQHILFIKSRSASREGDGIKYSTAKPSRFYFNAHHTPFFKKNSDIVLLKFTSPSFRRKLSQFFKGRDDV